MCPGPILLEDERLVAESIFDGCKHGTEDFLLVGVLVDAAVDEPRPQQAVSGDDTVAVQRALGSAQTRHWRHRIARKDPKALVVAVEDVVAVSGTESE